MLDLRPHPHPVAAERRHRCHDPRPAAGLPPDLVPYSWAADAPLQAGAVLLTQDGAVWYITKGPTPEAALLRRTMWRLWAPGPLGWNRVGLETFVEIVHASVRDRYLLLPVKGTGSIRVEVERWIRAKRPILAATGFNASRGRLPNVLERFEWICANVRQAEAEVHDNPGDKISWALTLYDRLVDSQITHC